MRVRTWLVIAACAVLNLAAAPAARAQAPVDTAGLARATGAFLVDSVLPHVGREDATFISAPGTAFDSAVAAILDEAPGTERFGPTRPPAFGWIGTRGFTVRGDTVAVLVVVGDKARPDPRETIDTYIEENRFLFVREARGWRYVRREFVRGMDAGPVRG